MLNIGARQPSSMLSVGHGYTITRLVGGFKHVLFSIMYGIILPIDFHIFQRGRGRYTTNQKSMDIAFGFLT